MYDVHQDDEAHLVRAVDERLEVVGGAAAARCGKEVGHVVPVRRGDGI